METDEDNYYALPQVAGKQAHASVDEKSASTSKHIIQSLSVTSYEYGISGKIDIYDASKQMLIERKNNLKRIFQGQIYQLWAQYVCLIEMGYKVSSLAFYEVTTKKYTPIDLPDANGLAELKQFLNSYRNFNPRSFQPLNTNKCAHCIYCALCDKYSFENVY